MLTQNLFNSNLIRTGYSTMGFFPKKKTISQIKRENLETRQSTYNYIESMYRTGGTFKYNLKKPHIGSHRSHLGYMEDYIRKVKRDDFERENKIYLLQNECEIMRLNLKDDYKNLKYEMNTQIDNLQMKFNLELGKQKIRNSKINSQMKELNKEMLESQNLVSELKERINSLKLRIDGNGMFNEDGLPFLNTKIE
jgi:hypothetical protein